MRGPVTVTQTCVLTAMQALHAPEERIELTLPGLVRWMARAALLGEHVQFPAPTWGSWQLLVTPAL